ncbi:MAG: hypothetical protein N2C13_03765 [Chloroflexota bacterium]
MRLKLEKLGDELIIELPAEHINKLGWNEGDEVNVSLDQANQRLLISPPGSQLSDVGIDETFARQVADFIKRYKPALEQLAKK